MGGATGAARFALRVASLSRSDARRASKSRRGIVADRPARRGRVGGAVDGAAGGGGVGTRGDRGAGGFAWRVAVGVLAVAGGAYFAILAARARAWSDDVDVWRGVRDPKRPTTRRPIASSSLFSPPREMNTSLTFPAASPSPRAPHPPPRTRQVVHIEFYARPEPAISPARLARLDALTALALILGGIATAFPAKSTRGVHPGWTSAAAAHRARVAAFVLAAIFGAVAAHGWYAALTRAAALARAAFPTRMLWLPLAPSPRPSRARACTRRSREPSSTRARSEDTCTDTRERRRVVKHEKTSSTRRRPTSG